MENRLSDMRGVKVDLARAGSLKERVRHGHIGKARLRTKLLWFMSGARGRNCFGLCPGLADETALVYVRAEEFA